jgi:glyoxylase-like metal-dependent hydrolase (beta-lactamase superfamily II)
VLEPVCGLVRRILAPNPGPFTFTGTNTFVVGQGRVAVIDPGPLSIGHVEALLASLGSETVGWILVTHTHIDHSPAAALLKARTGAPTYGFGPHGRGADGIDEAGADRNFVPDVALADGEMIEGPDWRLQAVHTPGHASNHLCIALPQERLLLSGDHVMGWSTTVVSPPDGDMTAYMNSLHRLLQRDDTLYLPAHGPAITDPLSRVGDLIAHRKGRRAAILRELAGGEATIDALVRVIYAGLDPFLHPAAGRSVLAHLIELVRSGEVAADGPVTITARYRLG